MSTISMTSELEAVNYLLGTIGELPVNQLEGGSPDVALARQFLNTASRTVQKRGWSWNTVPCTTLARSVPSGEISVPSNTLGVDTVGPDKGYDVVLRGSRLFDRQRNTYAFPKGLTVKLTQLLDFADVPEAARQLIMLSAARSFEAKLQGSDGVMKDASREEVIAMADLMNYEAETADLNVLTGSWSIREVLDR